MSHGGRRPDSGSEPRGAAVALGHVEVAIVLAVMDMFTMVALAPVKRWIDTRPKANGKMR